ncbi:MAG: hypothetical protein ACQEQC_00890 [Elusimicrobiota bacterium]
MGKSNNKEERRSTKLIKKNFQTRFLKLIGISLSASVIVSMMVFYIALRVKIERAHFAEFTQRELADVLGWLNWTLPVIAVAIIIIALLIGKHISFKVAGPLYALEKQLHLVLEGKIEEVQLRNDDKDLIPLAKLINRLINKCKGNLDLEQQNEDKNV